VGEEQKREKDTTFVYDIYKSSLRVLKVVLNIRCAEKYGPFEGEEKKKIIISRFSVSVFNPISETIIIIPPFVAAVIEMAI
jgi:hypothetical protein